MTNEIARQVGGHWHDYPALTAGTARYAPLTIECVGAPAPGGARNLYEIKGFQVHGTQVPLGVPFLDTPVPLTIHFHSGNPKNGYTGVTMEALVAVVVDRLKGLQDGLHPCIENDAALVCFQEGLQHLHARSRRIDETLRAAEKAAAETEQ